MFGNLIEIIIVASMLSKNIGAPTVSKIFFKSRSVMCIVCSHSIPENIVLLKQTTAVGLCCHVYDKNCKPSTFCGCFLLIICGCCVRITMQNKFCVKFILWKDNKVRDIFNFLIILLLCFPVTPPDWIILKFSNEIDFLLAFLEYLKYNELQNLYYHS